VSKHTKEPWEVVMNRNAMGHSIKRPDGGSVVLGALNYEDARRIVACVNACAGIPTEMLEDAKAGPIRDEHGEVVAWSIVLRSTIAKLEGK
jgi:hypothetical protein